MIKVMVSGVQSSKEAMGILDEKIAYVGLTLFHEESEDYIKMENAYGILRVLQAAGKEKASKSVAVTHSPTMEQIAMIQKFGFDYIQVSGKLEKEIYDIIKLPVIRTLDEEHISALDSYLENEKVTAILFDVSSYKKKKHVEWERIEHYTDHIRKSGKTLMLAGNLEEKDLQDAVEKLQPDVIDVNIGKDMNMEQIHTFMELNL